jgi:hypothetical protein
MAWSDWFSTARSRAEQQNRSQASTAPQEARLSLRPDGDAALVGMLYSLSAETQEQPGPLGTLEPLEAR